MAISNSILSQIEQTSFIDTHEHLWEESTRINNAQRPVEQQAPHDFSLFFYHYADSDLISAGMPEADMEKLRRADVDIDVKWRLFAPWYEKTRNTGYLRAARESMALLYGEEDVTEHNYRRISELVAAGVKPGYYKDVLRRVARIEYAQVNSFEDLVFNQTQYPELTAQDLSFVALSTGITPEAVAELSRRSGISVKSLKHWREVIDWTFAEYGPRAIAVKNQSAYERRLDYAKISESEAAPVYERWLKDATSLAGAERKAIEDHLFHYCVEKAAEYKLPVKLHTGYYAGHGRMPLARVQRNAGDLSPILHAHPNANFVIMHITYPYQDEAIALAKHYPNAFVDMCWAWIINPAAGVRFVKEFVTAAPANKLLTFGGDYGPVESVPGHAQTARRGLGLAITELVENHWIDDNDVHDLIERLMFRNARELFDYDGTLANWKDK